MRDAHGDRMTDHEVAWETRVDGNLPIYASVDGCPLSRVTAGMRRPAGPAMSAAMIATAGGLVERTHARLAMRSPTRSASCSWRGQTQTSLSAGACSRGAS